MEQIEHSESSISRVGKNIVLLPGSFKPPHKGHWEMVMDNINTADEIHIFISNTSTKYISERKLSKSNLKPLGKILSKIEDEVEDKTPEITQFCEYIGSSIDTINYNMLKAKLEEVKSALPDDIQQMIDNYLKDVSENIFKSIRYTSAGTEITPEVSQEIFEQYIKDYNVGDKVFVHISTSPSPMIAAIGFTNATCKDCNIYIGSNTQDEAKERAKSINELIKGFSYNPTNKINLLPVANKIQAARDIRANINNLSKDMFPSEITDGTYNKIVELLTNNISESQFNQLFNTIITEFKHQ